jgi:DNA-binding MarR family transcriptional regulator
VTGTPAITGASVTGTPAITGASVTGTPAITGADAITGTPAITGADAMTGTPAMRGAPAAQLDEQAVRELAVLLHDLSDVFRCDRGDQLQPPPLPAAGWEALRAIVATPGVTVAQLAVALGKQVSNVSGLVRELVARDLVTRQQDAADRRYCYLYPTEAAIRGKDLLESKWGRHLHAALAAAPAADAERLLSAIPTLRTLASFLRSVHRQAG